MGRETWWEGRGGAPIVGAMRWPLLVGAALGVACGASQSESETRRSTPVTVQCQCDCGEGPEVVSPLRRNGEQLHPDTDIGIYTIADQQSDGSFRISAQQPEPLIFCVIRNGNYQPVPDYEYWYVKEDSPDLIEQVRSAQRLFIRAERHIDRQRWGGEQPFEAWLAGNYIYSGQRVDALVDPSDWHDPNFVGITLTAFRGVRDEVLSITSGDNSNELYPDPIISFDFDESQPVPAGDPGGDNTVLRDPRLSMVSFLVLSASDRVTVRYTLNRATSDTQPSVLNVFQRMDLEVDLHDIHRVATENQFLMP